MTIKGYPIEGNREDITNALKKMIPKYATLIPVGYNRRGLDVVPSGVFLVAGDVVVEAGSTNANVKITGHSVRKGDLIRIKTTANGILDTEISVEEIVDADNFLLAGVLSANLAAGDTIDILRAVVPRYTSDGASLTTVVSPPIQYLLNGVVTTVARDTITPSNNRPLPVQITDVTGDINITAGDLNVQLSHSGANPDSVQLGDGTTTVGVTLSNELKTSDASAQAFLNTISTKDFATQTTLASVLADTTALVAKDFATQTTLAALDAKFNSLGQKTMAGSVPVVLASDQSVVNIGNITGTVSLPTGAATEATLSTINGKLPASLGQKSSANSLAVVLSSDQENILQAIKSDTSTLAGTVAAGHVTVAVADPGTLALEATQAAMSAKLPATLGQTTKAASMSVTIASDQNALPIQTTPVVDFFYYNVSTGITDTAYTQIYAATAATGKKLQLFMNSGEMLYLAIGGAGSELNKCIIPPGGFVNFPIELDIPAGSRLSVKRVKAGTSGLFEIIGNILG